MKAIKLTESHINNIVREVIKHIINENNENLETWYRGYNSKYGSQNGMLLWLTDDISYARAYGNRVEAVVIDKNKLNSASLYDVIDELDYYEGPNEEEIKWLIEEGYNCYFFEANNDSSYCMCLWDSSPIVSRRELPREDFDQIETYDGFDNPQYDDEY